MRTVVSTIGTSPYGFSKYLIKMMQPTLNNSQHKIKKSVQFVNKSKAWKISPTEIQVSYVVNLYPSVSLDKAIHVIVKYLQQNDFNNVKRRTKLTLVDIHQLLELCLSECYFLYKNLIWKSHKSGPIGLSFMMCFLRMLSSKTWGKTYRFIFCS